MSRPAKPMAERFWPKVDKSHGHGPDGTCWLWTGALKPNGYGCIGQGRRGCGMRYAHRVAWQMANGRPPRPGLAIAHICDVRNCVNPDHLREWTYQQNIQDMHRKGRASKVRNLGEAHHNHKLTLAQAREIRESSDDARVVAARHGVSASLVWQIRRGVAWRWLDVTCPARDQFSKKAKKVDDAG